MQIYIHPNIEGFNYQNKNLFGILHLHMYDAVYPGMCIKSVVVCLV